VMEWCGLVRGIYTYVLEKKHYFQKQFLAWFH
jgi:hypothetical protein